MNLRIAITESASPLLDGMISRITGPRRTGLHQAMGNEVKNTVVSYFLSREGQKAKAASGAGKPHSGWFAQAARATNLSSVTASDATVSIAHPGIARAFHAVTIVPVGAKALAIPIHPLAYGQRAAALWDRLKLFIPKGKRIIAMMSGGVLTPLYILTNKVNQPQDRTLLPTSDALRDSAAKGALQFILGT